jgi:imidazole glycerol-phosphate synthase subunit HisF
MLRTRIIPVLTIKDRRMIKTLQFDAYRDVGDPVTTAKYYDSQDVDELVLLDITATQEQRDPDWEILEAFSKECMMPLTIGGGVQSVAHMRRLLSIGADKVSVNSKAVDAPDFLTDAADNFGVQCVVLSMDVKVVDGEYRVVTHGGSAVRDLEPVEWAVKAAELGAGEILLNSIDRDGTMTGYDLDLLKSVANAVSVPVVALGGVGTLDDIVDGFTKGGAHALGCSSIFHFTDNKPVKASAFADVCGMHVRHV